jgi:hypothetical protein
MEDIECGNTETIPNHLNTLSHTAQANRQEAKRWFSDSPTASQKTQEEPPTNTIPRRTWLDRVERRPKRVC